jgi:LPXTG-site transpeptidase (sortase) family protein
VPATGFPQGQVTILPEQPLSKQYVSTGLTLNIPILKVNTAIFGVPQSRDGWDVTWLGNNAGWLNGTAFPTWSGNSVIAGHVWNSDNTPGIFVNLKQLRYGDDIIIFAFGQTYTYEVRENRLVWPDQSEIVVQYEDQPYLTLLTCEDYNMRLATYSLRRIVRAVLVNVQ